MRGPVAAAVEFESRKVYQSVQRPSYTSWVSFFPGEKGQWYLTCEEVTRPKEPLPKCTREQWYGMSVPVGYDKSQHLMEIVMLESTDDMKTWRVLSRQPCRFHHTAGSFGQARTSDGRFLRFLWSCYSLDPGVKLNEIHYESSDNGKTWQKMPPFHDARFASAPHRLRTLRDGTLVLAIPLFPRWGAGTDHPIRAAENMNALAETQMTLFFSFDQGRTWHGPLPIYGGQGIPETDFVELPSGDLLFINNSCFTKNPGRQFVYRDGHRFTPGPLERCRYVEPGAFVPETVCLTDDGLLVGCIRISEYMWSDDLGQSWRRIQGIPVLEGGMANPQRHECYQPWIHHLGGGRVACAGHYGGDDPLGYRDQYLNIHLFRVQVQGRTKECRLLLERDFDETTNAYKNTYTMTLLADGAPLPGQELEFWYVLQGDPAYVRYGAARTLEERMKLGGRTLRVRTNRQGKAQVTVPEMDKITDRHAHYLAVARFNADGRNAEYKPAQTPQFLFYTRSCQSG